MLALPLAISSNFAIAKQPTFTDLFNRASSKAYSQTATNTLNSQFIIKYKAQASYNRSYSKNLDQEVQEFIKSFANNQSRASYANNAKIEYYRSMALDTNYVIKADKKLSDKEKKQIIKDLMATGKVEYVEEDKIFKPTMIPNDPHYGEQWSLGTGVGGMNVQKSWDKATGQGVTVAVVDTGVTDHSDVVNNVLTGYDFISNPWQANDSDGRDSDPFDNGDAVPFGICGTFNMSQPSSWHGTRVSGVISAQANNGIGMTGVAYNAKIVPVRVLGKCGGNMSDIIDGLVWASGGDVPNAPKNQNPADVINMSLGGGGGCGMAMQQAVNTANERGSIVVAAAGNESQNASMTSPASCQGVISVAATTKEGGLASYSNFGETVDISAPGGDINVETGDMIGVLTTSNEGYNEPVKGGHDYTQTVGTSFASPHVAGIVAQMLELRPNADYSDVLAVLQSTAKTPAGDCSKGCGAGIVDANAVLNKVLQINELPPTPKPTAMVKEFNKVSSGLWSWQRFDFTVPKGAKKVMVTTSGGSGNPSLMLQSNGKTSLFGSECKSNAKGTAEKCIIYNPQGTINIGLFASWTFNDVDVKVVTSF